MVDNGGAFNALSVDGSIGLVNVVDQGRVTEDVDSGLIVEKDGIQ